MAKRMMKDERVAAAEAKLIKTIGGSLNLLRFNNGGHGDFHWLMMINLEGAYCALKERERLRLEWMNQRKHGKAKR